MSQHSIFIQTHAEACCLENDLVVSTPLGEYGGLPWLSKSGDKYMDVHFENAYLGEEVLAPPFQNQNMILGKGVHLHWIVPAFLGKEYDGKLNAAPNRWLVEKNNGEKWLVVSDYVHEAEASPTDAEHKLELHLTDDYSIYPVPRSEIESGMPPFCYLGKNFTIDHVPKEEDIVPYSFQKKFGYPLTILGFGHVQFSASYPNCKSVFGFHDPEGQQGDTYKITGWHSSLTDDLVWNALQAAKAGEGFELAAFLKEKFELTISEDEAAAGTVADLGKTLYVASIEMDSEPAPVLTNDLKIAVGNTATEAFSALMAHDMSSGQPITKLKYEDQLEYFLMNAQMDGHLTDQVPKFLEARHRKGFSLHNGGSLYALKEHFAGKTPEFEGYPLNDDLYDTLGHLNERQHDLNESENELESLKTQLYADWYKYMRAAYPPLGAQDLFPDRDHLQYFLETASLKELALKERLHTETRVYVRGQQVKLASLFKDFLTTNIEDHNKSIRQLEAENADGQAKKTPDLPRIGKEILAKLEEELSAVEAYLNNEKVQDILHLMATDDPRQNLQDPAVLKKYLDPGFPESPLLKEIPEKPFWVPTEPVIAVDGFKFGSRSPEISAKIGQANWDDTKALPAVDNIPFDSQKSSGLNWCPFFMEWAVGLEDAPLDITGLDSEAWKGAFFSHFYLDNDSPGVYRKKNAGEAIGDNDAYFQGGVILNPFMQSAFVDGMKTYADFCDKKITAAATDEDKELWKGTKSLADEARSNILAKDILCQRLSGFNAACLMLRQVPQLEMKEPLGFERSVAFSKAVADLCQGQGQLSPSPLYDFLPVRNGKLVIRQLRFLDNFGRAKDIDFKDFSQVITADTLTSEELRNVRNINAYEEDRIEALTKEIFLPPRLTQPARLNFHFLEGNDERMTDNPNTSPVCGWFVPNFLNENIMVFATNGQALGTLEKGTGWRDLPWEGEGNFGGTPKESVQNKVSDGYLQMVILKIMDQEIASSESSFIGAFLSALQDSLANIAPADFALQNAKALLMGRPIAVARVRAGLQIKGYPALDQSWQATLLDVQNSMESDWPIYRKDRFSGNWNRIDLPLRLGEHLQLNDGLLGYWLEKDGELSEQFYAPQTDSDDSRLITSYGEAFTEEKLTDNEGNPFIHKINPDGENLTFTVLMDPRAVLHATTGILPTEVISIPSDLYQKALEQMLMWFETGPVLHYDKPLEPGPDGETLQPKRYFDLPDIPDYKWKWFEKPMPGEELTKSALLETAKPDANEIHDSLPEIKRGYLVLAR